MAIRIAIIEFVCESCRRTVQRCTIGDPTIDNRPTCADCDNHPAGPECACGATATHDHDGRNCCGGMMCCTNANR